ncbi:MAG: homoserine O-acetyltransferase [Marinilabiliales bacterium]|nr:MAG: homoserine O-acetyltransferase [Marinilabiliales bacterium]
MSQLQIYRPPAGFQLDSGAVLPDLEIAYHTYGKLNEKQDNVIWVFHALTANSNVVDWWPELVGKEKAINPDEHFIICCNVLGSFYGSTGPRSINPETGKPYGLQFPVFTVRDVVKAQLLLAESLNVQKVKMLIGGSFGGFQVLEFAFLFKGQIDHLTLVTTSAKETAWSIAIHESQRLSLTADPSFYHNDEKAGQAGMKAARGIGLLTYRTYEAYKKLQTDDDGRLDDFSAASYIRYQGEKLVKRFHAHCYWYLSKCLDTHDVGRNRGGLAKALESIKIPTQVIGIATDRLVPTEEQKLMARHIPNAEYIELKSEYGHDGFLIEGKKIGDVISKYLKI